MHAKMKLFAVKFRLILKFSASKFYKKKSGHIFTIYMSKNTAVCCGIQTHFASFRLARFVKNILGTLSRFMHPKIKPFTLKFRRILQVFTFRGLQ